MTIRKTHEQFLVEMQSISPSIEILSSYSTRKAPISCRCRKCGWEWRNKAGYLLDGSGCPKCSGRVQRTHEEFIGEMAEVNSEIQILSQFRKTTSKVDCECLKCGWTWSAIPYTLLKGHGCPKCAGRPQKTTEYFKSELKEVNPDIEVLGEYVNDREKILCKCRHCKNEWRASPSHLLQQKGCPRCAHNQTSFMEQYIYWSFAEVLGEKSVFSRRKMGALELDIYVPSLGLALEPGSWAWHSGKIDRDREKRDACRAEGIRLITLYDSCPLPMPPFEKDCLIFSFGIEKNKGLEELKSFLVDLFGEYEINPPSKTSWKRIKENAVLFSRRLSTKQFSSKMESVNPSLKVIGEYIDAHAHVEIECCVCGNRWSAAPKHLLQGHGCPKCMKRVAGFKRRTSSEDFLRRVTQAGGKVDVLGEYDGASKKILVKCQECGHEWAAHPGALLKGHGCAKCAGVAKKTTSEFKSQLSQIAPTIEVLGEYTQTHGSINVRCRECGHEWSPEAKSLLLGRRCPKCAIEKRSEKQRKPLQLFKAQVSEKNPLIKVVGDYVNSNTKVRVICLKCSYEWDALPKSLLKGIRCPSCRSK
ncbi:MAG: zinc-ribbon domain-containing protein [Kiritimatiellae bacterium]|nr:zinc-ribbon domain-containing protein [Kiritimatiellia bacterium]